MQKEIGVMLKIMQKRCKAKASLQLRKPDDFVIATKIKIFVQTIRNLINSGQKI